ncbi:Glucosamine--fructose-6-phosphate aminotransferase [Candidatus Rhodobacter oscarellae]|uniref:Glutamine--fructose-6-phosphate aminotransferase [isomerizing] n=2 Tax=Candidatus Rhodobacter oscarellae TaxID=1675527 RepID=A0A0J9E1D5_9RHOB|nr:Glucosamine--fructose-6-phosphate aminotransferase [Candidatus Rhodobacter lobularis]
MVEALKRLEYRGYDSAGIATIDSDRRLARRRAVGKLVNLSDLLVHEPLAGKSGIGHTRWATHGGPTVTNAHPHRTGRVSVVHNGIIENFRELRAELTDRDVVFETETDTETVVALTEHFLGQGLSPRDAVEQTIARLEGAYALCFLFEGEDDLLIAARKGSPLVIGHGEGEVFVGSDAIALGPLTDRITYLEEGDWAVLRRDAVEIIDAKGNLANRPVQTIQIDATRVDKGGHKHFMAKEIAEQPLVIGECVEAYLRSGALVLPEDLDFKAFDRISIVACGTAYLAGCVARYWFERYARLPVEIDVASEFRYREPPIPARTLTIVLSQSGETADTLAALRYCEGKSQVLSITNVETSSIAREADVNLHIHAGTEIGVASTKAFTCKLTVLAVLALKTAVDRGEMDADTQARHQMELRRVPGLINQALEASQEIARVSMQLSEAQDVLFLGRGQMYPIAMEGALKLKEISYIHAEGYASGELKHGPIALIDNSVPVIVLAPSDGLFDKTVSNMQEVMARDGRVLLITDAKGAAFAKEGVWNCVVMPDVPELLAPIVYAVPAQLLAYHTAVAKGTDVDQPRNLAKSVTVE